MILIIIFCSICLPILCILLASYRRSLRYPEKKFINSVINIVLNPLRYFHIGPFKYGNMNFMELACKYAIKKTGYNDFGSMEFLNNYNLMMKTETFQKQTFSNLGYISSHIESNLIMVRRLRFIQYLKENPNIINIPIRCPVFVTGLPRTGTTFLHRLLSLDPAVRSPLLWELLAPVPIVNGNASPEEKEKDSKKRINFVKQLIASKKQGGDLAVDHIHEVGYNLPEECLMAMNDEIPISLPMFYTSFTNYEYFLENIKTESIQSSYAYYKKILQLLNFHSNEMDGSKTWVLKCPIHLFFIKELAAIFPDAKIIWTHRHPVSAIPSLCSLLKSFHQVYFEEESRDDNLIGRQLSNLGQDFLNRAGDDMEKAKLGNYNASYEMLVKDPIGLIKSIYQEFKWNFTLEYEIILKKYLAENAKNREEIKLKRGNDQLHTYEPEEFGLTTQELCEGRYADYCKKYNVPMSRN